MNDAFVSSSKLKAWVDTKSGTGDRYSEEPPIERLRAPTGSKPGSVAPNCDLGLPSEGCDLGLPSLSLGFPPA